MASLSGFSDPNWNWGSSVGTGHDAAMNLRSALGTSDKRVTFIQSIVNSSDQYNLDDVKLALALRFQRASRERIDGSNEGYIIMERMARLKYEGPNGEMVLLKDLTDLAGILPVDLMNQAGVEGAGGPVQHVAAMVLCGMKFCAVGL